MGACRWAPHPAGPFATAGGVPVAECEGVGTDPIVTRRNGDGRCVRGGLERVTCLERLNNFKAVCRSSSDSGRRASTFVLEGRL